MKVFNFAKAASLLFLSVNFVLAQMPKITVPPAQTPQSVQSQAPVQTQTPIPEDNTWWYLLLFLLFAGLAGTIVWMIKSKKQAQNGEKGNKSKPQEVETWDEHSVDADKEMEWFRKHKKSVNSNAKNSKKGNLPQASKVLNRKKVTKAVESSKIISEEEFQERLEKLQYSQLPISRVEKIELSKPFNPLPLSNDEALMSAIEQVQDEYEEDEEVRDLALRILTAFKTRNSVESLSQIALYDLSSNLRSKAVGTLADFDHESCFEPILLACADPTREVRAAAARGLFRLSFDRADAWTRIAETGDEFKMRQAARAAIEADLVKRSFDRLAHNDLKYAYEAMTLVALLLRAGETREVFDALQTHPVLNVRKAILQIIKITKEPNALEGLYSLLEKNSLPAEFHKEIDETIKEVSLVMA
jgi:hypothetical protein